MYSPKISKASAPAAVAFPFQLHAGRFENANHGLRDFGADAVAGDQRDFVRLCLCHDLCLS